MTLSDNNFSHCHFVQHKFYADYPKLQPGCDVKNVATAALWNDPLLIVFRASGTRHKVTAVWCWLQYGTMLC